MHYWGDEDFDWEGLNKALDILDRTLRFWNVPVFDIKEKYGTARVYLGYIGHHGFHSMWRPRHCYVRWPKWLYRIDLWISYRWFMKPFWAAWSYIHRYGYRRAYRKALQAYPELAHELLCDADWSDALKGLQDPAKCDHLGGIWCGGFGDKEYHRCGTCQLELTKEQRDAIKQHWDEHKKEGP